MSDGLAAFLRARLDEDEAMAWACYDIGPERMRREVEAKRAILAVHRTEIKKLDVPPFDQYTGTRNPDEYEVTCEVCGWASDDPTSACPTVRHLAAVYRDHPGYRQEWAL